MRLFHYTTREAARKILWNRELWFTRSDCFDDENEFTFFSEVAKTVVVELFDDSENAPWALKHYLGVSDKHSDDKGEEHVLCSPDILRLGNNRGFVLSASADGNNGYLQGAYCDPDSIKVALVVDADALVECIRSMGRKEIGAVVEPVVYGKKDATEKIVGIITEEMSRYRDCPGVCDSGLCEIAAERVNYNLEYAFERAKPFVKREKFREEEEVRALLSLPDEAKFETQAKDGTTGIRAFRDDEKRWRASLWMGEEWFSRVVVGIRKFGGEGSQSIACDISCLGALGDRK